jgi:hypothetical protein
MPRQKNAAVLEAIDDALHVLGTELDAVPQAMEELPCATHQHRCALSVFGASGRCSTRIVSRERTSIRPDSRKGHGDRMIGVLLRDGDHRGKTMSDSMHAVRGGLIGSADMPVTVLIPHPLEFTNFSDVIDVLGHQSDLREVFRIEVREVRPLRKDAAHAKAFTTSADDAGLFVEHLSYPRGWNEHVARIQNGAQ